MAHFFVFYYGVLADITPPVALAAYAAAGMAGSDPFKTGNTAFRLGLARRWCRSCSCSRRRCCWWPRASRGTTSCVTFVGCVLGIAMLAAALSKFFLVEMQRWERWCVSRRPCC